MSSIEQQAPKDVAPEWVLQLLGLAWLLLLGGRWILSPILVFMDPAANAYVSDLDHSVLLRLYLALLSITLLIPALRYVRMVETRSKPASPVANKENDDR